MDRKVLNYEEIDLLVPEAVKAQDFSDLCGLIQRVFPLSTPVVSCSYHDLDMDEDVRRGILVNLPSAPIDGVTEEITQALHDYFGANLPVQVAYR